MVQLKKHWLFEEELKWRILASIAWTFIITFASSVLFLFVWMLSPHTHLYLLPIPNYFIVMTSIRPWLVSLGLATLLAAYSKLHLQTCKVKVTLQTSLLDSLKNVFKPTNMFYALLNGLIGAGFIFLTFMLTNSSFSQLAVTYTDGETEESCLNENLFIATVFGFVMGFCQSMRGLDDDVCTLAFNCVQPAQLSSIKYRFNDNLLSSFHITFYRLRWFLVSYWLFGKQAFLFTADLFGAFTESYEPQVSFMKPFGALSLAWCLLITGTFLLLARRVSWELFNLFLVKNFSFSLETFFKDDNKKTLTANLGENQPALVQHIAFQSLSELVCYSAVSRQKLFEVPADSSTKDTNVKWNVIANECLSRINKFNEDIKMHYYEVVNGKCLKDKKKVLPSVEPVNKTPANKIETLRRRPMHLNNNNINTSFAHLRSPNTSMLKQHQDSPGNSSFLDTSTVQSPRLWTVPSSAGDQSVIFNQTRSSIDKSLELQQPPKVVKTRDFTLKRFLNWLTTLPLINFFIAKQADRTTANLFSDFHIIRWSVRILSILSANSLHEDKCGVVQCRLSEVLESLVELLTGLERNCKMPVANSSPQLVVSLIRRQHSLKSECVSALYRVSTAFPNLIDSVPMKPEHARRLAALVEFKG